MSEYRTFAQRCSDRVTEFCGSWGFFLWCSLLIGGWIAVNTVWLAFAREFDPYPFIALNLVLTVVSTLQGPLIMMSQNRQADRDRAAVIQIDSKLNAIRAELEGARLDVAKAMVTFGVEKSDGVAIAQNVAAITVLTDLKRRIERIEDKQRLGGLEKD